MKGHIIFFGVIREEKQISTYRTVEAWIAYCHYKGIEEDFHCPQRVIKVNVFSIKEKETPQVLSFLEYFEGFTYLKNIFCFLPSPILCVYMLILMGWFIKLSVYISRIQGAGHSFIMNYSFLKWTLSPGIVDVHLILFFQE